MKRVRFYAMLFALVTFVACSDDFVPVLTTDLKTDTFEFASEGGEQTFVLETNEQWSVNDVPEWITVKVTDASATRAGSASYESGKKEVAIVAKENLEYEDRAAELTMVSASGNMVKLKVTQEKGSKLITDLDTDQLSFAFEGGKQSFLLESNEGWTMSELPSWVTVVVKEYVESATRNSSYESGKKEITITVEANPDFSSRKAELIMTSKKGVTIKLQIVQAKKSGLTGYWILSEGFVGQGNAELAWYDLTKGELAKNQFKAINGIPLGDTGNELQLYGAKMYVVVTGSGFGTETTADNSYIEVINPIDGKSIKRIPFLDAKGVPAKPRNIIFEGGKGYISSYSNEVVRLDTATLTLDAHAALSGIMAEGLTYKGGSVYICNGGQGQDNKISIVDATSMKETKVITTASNPSKIVTAANGDIYFTTDWPAYKLYKLKTADETITEVAGLKVGDIAHSNNKIYSSYYDWDTSKGELKQYNTLDMNITAINLDFASAGATGIVKYHVGAVNGSDHLYVTGMMSDDVVIFDPATQKIAHAFKTGVNGGSGVVAVYR